MPAPPKADATLVDAYIRFASAEHGSSEYDDYFWASDRLWNLARNEPLEAWRTIVAICDREPGDRVIELLAAGPLEDLLVAHGRLVIDEIERCARMDKGIALLLGGVWRNDIDEDVWSRVERARSRRW